MTVTETIRCPGCSTRFALRPDRVHAGLRRAKCFKCETIFEIGEAVERLLALEAPEVPGTATADLPVAPAPGTATAELPIAPAPGTATADLPAPPALAAEEDSPFASFDAVAPPSLTLGDLEGAEDEIMEKTLVILPPPPPPPPVPEPAEATSTGGYSSAKDAIARLMGDAPAPQASERRGNRSPMDVEATLSALEDTLSGTQPLHVTSAAMQEATASTMKLSSSEIQAAMASFAAKNPAPPPPAPPRYTAPPRAELPPPPRPAEPPPTSQGSDLLKIQVEQETLQNVTLDQVTTWIEQGRVQEYHMVARQFSDHWIEALKVPALRPVFDRKRREGAGLELSSPPPDLAPAKKSLFGGLFGRN
jgi:hypothetical protein